MELKHIALNLQRWRVVIKWEQLERTGTLELLIMGAKVELQEEGLTKLWDRMEEC